MVSKRPTSPQLKYLRLGRYQPGGKLPLFDPNGQQIKATTIRSCIRQGWATYWFENPIKADWLVCKLTEAGVKAVDKYPDRH
ncbi:MAG: hypothetical protein COB93_09255 [Sneathiella sp.]|nr:MAG: hypothetical protein COB93_09255 [Sneathiella sp.]